MGGEWEGNEEEFRISRRQKFSTKMANMYDGYRS
jgi:hypothetical protein